MTTATTSTPIGNRVPRYSALSRHIGALLQADEGLIAAFWDDGQPASVNLENIAYWLGQSAEAPGTGEEQTESP
ncbi:hypothetical protein [Lentisalinibacter sediminis]|uniref:hypothetical protein n=1 Tax=Lentisalinibacter sediminis TaxID=2992237 RepID=UPI00386ABEED